ncbi:MAG: hypothetical protein V4675_15620 [Verrucomicrobiota bacterium]
MRDLLQVLCCSLWLASAAGGATLDVRFIPSAGTQGDPSYPGISTLSVGTVSLPGVVATLAGRGYGAEQTGQQRWGISAGTLPWDQTKTGWTVRDGFAPDKTGLTVSRTGKVEGAASYLSIMLSGVTSGTVFQKVVLTFSDVTGIKPDKAWAGTSADAFAAASTLKLNNKGGTGQMSVTLSDFTYTGGAPLEIRIYGVIGEPEGGFTGVSLIGDATLLTAVPEPDGRLLLTTVGLGAAVAFRRRSGQIPR